MLTAACVANEVGVDEDITVIEEVIVEGRTSVEDKIVGQETPVFTPRWYGREAVVVTVLLANRLELFEKTGILLQGEPSSELLTEVPGVLDWGTYLELGTLCKVTGGTIGVLCVGISKDMAEAE